MSAAHAVHSTPTAGPVLYVAFELSWGTWKMAFTVGAGQSPGFVGPSRKRLGPKWCQFFFSGRKMN